MMWQDYQKTTDSYRAEQQQWERDHPPRPVSVVVLLLLAAVIGLTVGVALALLL